MRRFVILICTFAFLFSCKQEESLPLDAVFDLARSQSILLASQLGPDETARTFQGDSLVTASPKWWCSGFFPGTLWYIYEYTGDETIRELALRETAKVEDVKWNTRDHDVGFIINCSFGNQYRITGDAHAREVMETAARSMSVGFNPTVGCMRSWYFQQKRWHFPVIIDNMMNLELLAAVGQMAGADSLTQVAVSHARTTIKNHFREDYTCFHLVDYEPEDGSVRGRMTVQGYADSSSWARGQAWALYGYTMMHRFTGEAAFLHQAEAVGNMLIERLPSDGIPYWDFDAPDIPDAPKDASAAAVMASAFIELSTCSGNGKPFRNMAYKQLRTLCSPEYLSAPGENGGFILRHSVGHFSKGSEIDVPLTYADYYFLEALLRWNNL